MAAIVLLLIALGVACGAYGYFRGGMRLGVSLLPPIVVAAAFWLFGATCFGMASVRNYGLVWPALLILVPSLTAGLGIRYLIQRRLPKRVHMVDRAAGALAGLVGSLLLAWLGCVQFAILAAARDPGREDGPAILFARAVNGAFIQRIPIVGSGGRTMMNLLEIATAEESVRRAAVVELGLDRLRELPEMQAILSDTATQADIEAAAKGNLSALWRLQRNAQILRLFDNEEMAAAVSRRTLDELADGVRRAKGAGD